MNSKCKKILFIGILSVLALLVIPNKVNAATYTDSETGITWNYVQSGNNATNVYIDSYPESLETLIIPNKINGYTVTAIRGSETSVLEADTYRQNILKTNTVNTSIKKIILPETLTGIGRNTFANFQGITSLVIPDSVTSIGEYAFYSCTKLNELTLPVTAGFYTYNQYKNQNTYQKMASFYKCSAISVINLTKGTTGILPDYNSYEAKYTPWYDNSYSGVKKTINILDGVTRLGNYGFYSNNKIESVNIADSVKEIGNYTFYYASNMTMVNLPETIEKIGDYGFYNCYNWVDENFSLPQNLKSLGKYSFYNCNKLKGKLLFPDTITVIPERSFSSCKSITEIEFGNNVTEIGQEAFQMCSGIKTLTLPGSLNRIGNSAFYQCTDLTGNLEIPESVTYIGDSAFKQCIKLTGDLIIPDNVVTIGNYAFQNNIGFDGKVVLGSKVSTLGISAFSDCNFKEAEIKDGVLTKIPTGLFKDWLKLSTVKLGNSIIEIGDNAFEGCKSLKELPLNENIQTIGANAFKNCTGIKGDLTIPDTITSIGQRAFYGCDGIDGIFTLGKGMNKIESFTFYGCPNMLKLVIPAEIKTIERFALWGVSEIWYLGEEEDLEISSTACGGNVPFIHYKNCTHKLTIDVPEGYEIINKETNEVLQASEYKCETNLKIGLRIKQGYQINNDLNLIISKQGKYKDSENIQEKFSLLNFDVYEISRFDRDYSIIIKDTSVTTDLALRTYIYQVNYNDLETSRMPKVQKESGIISYNHTKKPLIVNKGDLITFKIRVYNEGDKPGVVNEISKYLPEGLVLANSETNRRYKWVEGENGKISTRYFEDKTIEANTGESVPYEEISLICKVTSLGTANADTRLVTIAEISEGGTKDTDSTYGQINSRVDSTYKLEESNASTENSFVRSDDDDTDFENVIIKPTLPVEYTIKITKVDTDTNELLAGAVFNLKDTEGNIVSTATTDEKGVLSFGLITSYGEGTDIYYIEEALAPEGYMITEKSTIEVNVTKTLIDETLGTYSLKVVCQTLNYSTDITRYDYIPIATAEDLQKVGSGEWIEYEGIKYLYAETANYKLVNDINLDGIAWKPINKKVSGIFDGNGHTIRNLTIVSDEEYTYSEVGLFRYFSGIVQGVNLENVNIVVPGMVIPNEDKGIELDTLTGKTCVGGFAGFMEKGTVKSCSISGQITAGCSNVGGFIGHSSENNIIKFQNCTNSAKITATKGKGTEIGYNIGGMIGCAIGSLSLNDCVNEGEIEGNDSNVGGLVGFVESTGYEEIAIKAGYTEDDKVITLLIGNSKTKGKYDIILENRDVKTLGFIAGAKYSVYDSKLQQMAGYEEIQLDSGKLRVAAVDINYVGTDTYYIKEVKPAPGYERLKSYVKLIVSRYWDAETSSFRVTVEAENIVDDKIDEEEKKENTYKELESLTGSVNTMITFEGVGWNNDKVSFIDCANNANILGDVNIGGLLGSSRCKIQMNRCNNTGNITAQNYNGKAGGLIADVLKKNNDNIVEIQNCTNEGEIYNLQSSGSAGGIIARSVSNIKIRNCVNKGTAYTGYNSSAGGIIADLNGIAEIRECTNEGDLIALSFGSDVNCVIGGIVGKNQVQTTIYDNRGNITMTNDEYKVFIYDSINTGNIKSSHHCGGMLAQSTGVEIKIENCINKDNTIYGFSSDSGGMIGFASVNKVQINNCITKNTTFSQELGGDYTYGATGGILGDLATYGYNTLPDRDLVISNCNVSDCLITSRNKEPAGILGHANFNSDSKTNKILITDCNVERCTIKNIDADMTYCASAGIFGCSYGNADINLKNCNVSDSYIASFIRTGKSGSDTNVGGVMGMVWDSKSMKLQNCNVDTCEIYNGAPSDGCANTAGIIAGYGQNYNSKEKLVIDNCDVVDSSLQAMSGNLAGTIGLCYQTDSIITNCDNEGITLYSTSTTSANSNTSGIIATSYNPCEIYDCSVKGNKNAKSVIYGRGRNVSGMAGWVQRDLTIKNAVVKDIVIESEGANFTSGWSCNDTVSGIVGICANKPSIDNCLVENAEIEGIVANATGVLGAAPNCYTATVLKDITVKNTKISNKMTYDRGTSNSSASGILGYLSGVGHEYANCTVENCQITGSGSTTSGMNAVCNAGKFTNCIVKDTTIKKNDGGASNPYSYTSVGGMIASSTNENLYMTDCSVENVNLSGDTYSIGGMVAFTQGIKQFDRNTVKDLRITGTSEKNIESNGSIAGMIADCSNYSSSNMEILINDCDITNFTAESGSNNIGGILGTNNNGSSIKFNDCDLDNLNLKYTNTVKYKTTSSGVYPRCIGGLIAIGGNKINVIAKNCTSKNSNYTALDGNNGNSNSSIGSFVGWTQDAEFKDSTITNNILNNETPIGMAGGAIGANLCSAIYNSTTGKWEENHGIVKTDNLTIKDCTVTANGATGGIMGYGVTQINNSTVNKCTIKDNSYNMNGAGGLVGFSLSITDNIIKDSSVIDSNITSKDYAGGIVGFTSGKIENCNVINTAITNENVNSSVGGIVGMIYDPSSKILNSTVSNSEIEGEYYAGGIVGFGEGDLADNKVIENTTVTAKGDWAVGGIIGMTKNTSSEITNCDVSDIGITGVTNYTGGIAGYVNNTISGCDIDRAQIIATGESVKALGGVLGHASNTTSLSNCSIANTIIQGNGADIDKVVGNVLGDIDCTSGCTVNEDTVIIGTPEEVTMLDDEDEQTELDDNSIDPILEVDESISPDSVESSVKLDGLNQPNSAESLEKSEEVKSFDDSKDLDASKNEDKGTDNTDDSQESTVDEETSIKQELLEPKKDNIAEKENQENCGASDDDKIKASDDDTTKEEEKQETAILSENEDGSDDSSNIGSSSI